MAAGCISVLVRSMARLPLARTLDSITAQTNKNLNIHVVAACGSKHPKLPKEWNGTRLYFHPSSEPLQRATAANRLLDCVDTEYFAFIDDDDEWCSDHLQNLSQILAREIDTDVAFSSAIIMDARGGMTGTIGHAFHPIELSLSCPIVFHSALYRSDSVAKAKARFDEAFEYLEDADFLLTLCVARLNFAWHPQSTALWNAMDGTSGHPFASSGDTRKAQQYMASLRSKWKDYFLGLLKDPVARLALARALIGNGDSASAKNLLLDLSKYPWRDPKLAAEYRRVCGLAGLM